jgi:hypothetical protein
MTRADQIAAAALRSNRVLLDAWNKAEDRTLRWQGFAAGVGGALALFRPAAGLGCVLMFGGLLVWTIRASRRDLKAIERAMELGHDHD